MDLFGLIRVEVFVLLPVFLYFLFCKNSGRSLYTGRGSRWHSFERYSSKLCISDYFYPIKYLLAKKVVRAAQEKSRKAREKLKNDSEVVFTSQKVVTKIILLV